MDSGSIFHFPHRGGINWILGDLLAFIIQLTYTAQRYDVIKRVGLFVSKYLQNMAAFDKEIKIKIKRERE